MVNSCLDSYNTTFSSYGAMLNYHEEQNKSSIWQRIKVNALEVMPHPVLQGRRECLLRGSRRRPWMIR